MKPTHKLLTKVGAIVVSVFSMSMLAQANSEIEPNSPASSAQTFAASSSELNVSGSLTYRGFDPRTRQPIRDVDFYSFFAFAGDNIDIAFAKRRNDVFPDIQFEFRFYTHVARYLVGNVDLEAHEFARCLPDGPRNKFGDAHTQRPTLKNIIQHIGGDR